MRLLSSFVCIIFLACSGNKKIDAQALPNQDSIFFVTLKISKDPILQINKIEVISKEESTGRMKSATNKNDLTSSNYLTIFIYTNKTLIDSFEIDHPLYKHFEYLDSNKKFAVKDTIVNKEEFFFRVQKQGTSTQLRIVETLKNKPKKELASIKL